MELTSKQRAQLRGMAAGIDTIVHARCEVVQVIGSKFVLYRMQHDKSRRKIELVPERKKRV